MLTYDQMQTEFRQAMSVLSPAECHGYLVGRIVVGHYLGGKNGVELLADFSEIDLSTYSGMHEHLTVFIEDTLKIFAEDLFQLPLFIPDDECVLAERMDGLAHWCQGFLAGLGNTAGQAEKAIFTDEADTLETLAAISQLDPDSELEGNDADAESDFVELYEYARLAALHFYDLFETLNQNDLPDTDQLH